MSFLAHPGREQHYIEICQQNHNFQLPDSTPFLKKIITKMLHNDRVIV